MNHIAISPNLAVDMARAASVKTAIIKSAPLALMASVKVAPTIARCVVAKRASRSKSLI